jgi:hypothetical protein
MKNTQHNDKTTLNSECCYAEYHNDECRAVSFMLSVFMLNAVMLNVVVPYNTL